MTGMMDDLERKRRHRQPRRDHPRRSSAETHLPGCPAYAANVTACPAECNCWPWTDPQAADRIAPEALEVLCCGEIPVLPGWKCATCGVVAR